MQADEYLKMAAVEDRMWYYRALHAHVTRALATAGLPEDAAVLDAGCGTGGLLKHLAARRGAWRLHGLDLSPLACRLARERTGAEIAEGSVAAPPYAPASFAAIVSCDVLCQVEDPVAALRALAACVRPGGVIVLTMPAYPWLFSYHDEQVGNLRRDTRATLLALLREAGLLPESITYWNTLPFPLAVLRRKILPPAAPASDVRLYPAPLEASFGAMMKLEEGWLRGGGLLPFGCSLLAVSRRPAGA